MPRKQKFAVGDEIVLRVKVTEVDPTSKWGGHLMVKTSGGSLLRWDYDTFMYRDAKKAED